MIDRLTTDQLHHGLTKCVACSVNGWPAVVEWSQKMPRVNENKPFAVIRWCEYEDRHDMAPDTFYQELKKADIGSITQVDSQTLRIDFKPNLQLDAIELRMFILGMIDMLCPAVKRCSIQRIDRMPGGVALEHHSMCPDSVN